MLRETTWRDIATLAAHERDLFGRDAWSEASWWSELAARPRRYYLTLADGAEILGYAGLDLGGEVADVMTIAVAPAARGAGHGGTLLAALVDAARADGAAHLVLEVRADNTTALRLYETRGFVEISRRRRYYGDVDAVVMRLSLGEATSTTAPSATASSAIATPTSGRSAVASSTGATPTTASPPAASPTNGSPAVASSTGSTPTTASPPAATPAAATPTAATPAAATPTAVTPTAEPSASASPAVAIPGGATPTTASPAEVMPVDATPAPPTPGAATSTTAPGAHPHPIPAKES